MLDLQENRQFDEGSAWKNIIEHGPWKKSPEKLFDFKITASKLKNGLCQRTESQARMEGWLANKELLTELKHKKEA